jgi:RNA polymerase primary sigma factor
MAEDEALSEPNESEQVEDALEILVGDHRRTGRLLPEDLARICSKRELSAEQIDELAKRLTEKGIVLAEEDVPDTFDVGKLGASNGFFPAKLPLLRREEEQRLAHSFRTGERLKAETEASNSAPSNEMLRLIGEGEKARNKLVLHNLRLVAWIANRYRWTKLEFGDLFQDGLFGLMRAAERFDPTLGFKFSTYATWWIYQSIERAIANTADTIRIPVHRLEAMRKYRRMVQRLYAEHGVEPSIQRTASALEWSVEQTAFVADLCSIRSLTLDMPIADDGNTTLQDVIPDHVAVSPERAIILEDMRATVNQVLSSLSAREERIIRKRFGIGVDRDHTLEEIGQEFGVTRERIRQIESKVLLRLKHPSRSRALRTFLD